MYDFLIANGLVVDGTGHPARKADVAVVGDKVVRIAPQDRRGRPRRPTTPKASMSSLD